ncbi:MULTISPECIES: 6-phospho-3-hexuloisomerase [Bacillus]|nr:MULTISPECIES: 6-phospho-3-hexuloisomerase [Bacillus]MDT0162279.1 6-phospho-3-hexuloisomerase [Bacillus sp. AG4(2022)]
MDTIEYLKKILNELEHAAEAIDPGQAEALASQILESGKVFTAGAGRSGFMAKSFAMRLMHMGVDAYVIGETVTPGFEENDLLIIGSGSGETKSLVSMAEKARSIGGKIAAATIVPDSSIASLADITVKMPGATKDQNEGGLSTIQPMGSLFEQSLLLLYDAIILRVMEKKGLDSAKMFGRHANLE